MTTVQKKKSRINYQTVHTKELEIGAARFTDPCASEKVV